MESPATDTTTTPRTTSRTARRADVDVRTSGYDRPVSWASGGWGPVLSGAVTAFIVFAILSSLWLALAGSGSGFIGDNFAWFELISALVAAPVGGFVAGWLQPGDAASGAVQGLATWGLLIFAGIMIGIPSGTALFSGATEMTLQSATDVSGNLGQFDVELWGVFIAFAGGALLAALGGMAARRARRSDHHDRGDTATTGRSVAEEPSDGSTTVRR